MIPPLLHAPKGHCSYALSAGARGFSLVEVTMAIGLVSFAVLSLFGLMSAGSTTVRDAINNSAYAQITSQVASAALLTRFSKIDAFVSNNGTNNPLRFNRSAAVTEDEKDTVYTASLAFTPTRAPDYPGAITNLDASARAVVIEVATVRPGTIIPIDTSRSIVIVPK